MRVGFFQYDVIYKNREANLEYITSRVKGERFDLLVLPEFFTAGYAFDKKDDLTPFLEDINNSPTVIKLTELAKDTGGCITGSIPECSGGSWYNTSILVDSSGLIGFYRKIHLPNYEKRFFTSGNQISAFEVDSVKIGMIVCFDCWFAPLTSKLKLMNTQIVCHSACFGGEVTPKIIPIRALENQYFVISCNRIGTELFDGNPDTYRGESQIVDPNGTILYKAGNGEELVFVDIDIEEVNNPVFGKYIVKDFPSEHNKYIVELKQL